MSSTFFLWNKKTVPYRFRYGTGIPAVPPKLMLAHPLVSSHTAMRAARITGADPVGCYLLALSTALVSPFTWASLPRFHRPRLSLNSAYMLLLLLTGLISVVVMDYNSKESVCQAVAMLRIRSIISFFLTFPLLRGARRIFRNPFRAARIFCPDHGAPEEDGKWPFGTNLRHALRRGIRNPLRRGGGKRRNCALGVFKRPLTKISLAYSPEGAYNEVQSTMTENSPAGLVPQRARPWLEGARPMAWDPAFRVRGRTRPQNGGRNPAGRSRYRAA